MLPLWVWQEPGGPRWAWHHLEPVQRDPVLAEAILAAFRSVGVERDLPAVAPERDSPARRALLKAWYLVRIVPNGIQGENDEEVERAQGEAADEDDGADAIVVGSRRR